MISDRKKKKKDILHFFFEWPKYYHTKIIFVGCLCDVTLSVYPYRAGLKVMPGHGGIRTTVGLVQVMFNDCAFSRVLPFPPTGKVDRVAPQQGLKNRHMNVRWRLYAKISLAHATNIRQIRSRALPTSELNLYPFLFALKSFGQWTNIRL